MTFSKTCTINFKPTIMFSLIVGFQLPHLIWLFVIQDIRNFAINRRQNIRITSGFLNGSAFGKVLEYIKT